MWLAGLLWLAAAGQYDLSGRIIPEYRASVSLQGATTPFTDQTLTDHRGRFRFRKLEPGTYTVSVFVPGRGEVRQTIEIGPSLADSKRRVQVTFEIPDSKFEQDTAHRGHVVSARQLSIPPKAIREYEEAQKQLGRRDVDGAVEHLRKAVELAPEYTSAWNNLGTIAYQTRQYAQAKEYFRKALDAEPGAFEPLVNLGGVLVTVGKAQDALPYNQHAVLARPRDALANSQLGMNYFQLGKLDLARKYLTVAKQIDPAHFSHPQLLLAEIAARSGDRPGAAVELEDLLRRHPDAPDAPHWKAAIEKLRQ
ncbi:MAG TPA: tetratricopeptide repeat protein [Bryobacteraceae bacterium]|nr:tetratricopeptide repeat protein [Bryobacteraceae bacterium]